jgi:hypothetical protein
VALTLIVARRHRIQLASLLRSLPSMLLLISINFRRAWIYYRHARDSENILIWKVIYFNVTFWCLRERQSIMLAIKAPVLICISKIVLWHFIWHKRERERERERVIWIWPVAICMFYMYLMVKTIIYFRGW